MKKFREFLSESKITPLKKYELADNMGDGEILTIGENGDYGVSLYSTDHGEVEINWGEDKFETVIIDDIVSEVKKYVGIKLNVKDKNFIKFCNNHYGFVPN